MKEEDIKNNSKKPVSGLIAHLFINGIKKGANEKFFIRLKSFLIAWIITFSFMYIVILTETNSVVGIHTIFALIGIFFMFSAIGITIGFVYKNFTDLLKIFFGTKNNKNV